MKRKSLLLLAATALVAMAFTACSETDNSANEFPNWQATNETYFDSIYNVAKANSAQWKVIPNITLPSAAVKKSTDNVAIQVIETGAGSEYAMQNDTVRVILQGRLKPSPGYPQGKVFQQTYVGTGDKTTASVAKMAMVTAVPGYKRHCKTCLLGLSGAFMCPTNWALDRLKELELWLLHLAPRCLYRPTLH